MTQPPEYAPRYFVRDNCLYETGINKQGAYEKKLCNFAPEVRCEIAIDDGVSAANWVRIGGIHQSGRTLPEITIPSNEVEGLGWIVKYWGMDCILEPGLKTKGSVWNALQTTALNTEKVTVFSATGWKKIKGEWHFLLPGDEQYTVELPGKMHGYGMERGYDTLDIQTAASLLWQNVAPVEIILPLLAFTFLSPLNHFLKAAGCEPKFVLFLVGKTGSRKSTLAALMLSFFGKFTASELPLSFRDTANSILHNAFALKDVLTCIDDLHPSSRQEEQKMNGTAQAVMRAYGDRTGKGRLRADSTPMESRPPQGNAIITAEFAPDIGESGTARYFALELKEKDVDLETLTAFQKEAANGTLQRCMFAYTEWLKVTFLSSEESVLQFQKYLHSRFLFYRDFFRSNGILCHGRVPETVAQLQIGMEFLLRFLCERGGFAEDWCNEIAERFQKILYSLAAKQAESVDEDKPTHIFIRKLFSLLESDRVCVLNRSQSREFIPGNCIGYEDASYFYLHTDIAHQMVCRLCEEQGENFVISSKGLLKALAEEGLIKTTAGQNTISIRVGRKSRRVMCLDKHKAQAIADEAL